MAKSSPTKSSNTSTRKSIIKLSRRSIYKRVHFEPKRIIKSTNQQATYLHPSLESLPIELYHYYIFNYLSLGDLFDLKLVSKRFYTIMNSFFINELFFIEKYLSLPPLVEHFSIKRSIDNSKQFLLKAPLLNFMNLRYLSINILFSQIEIKDINKFTKLQVLDIQLDYYYLPVVDRNVPFSQMLQLPELRELNIRIGVNSIADRLIIDTPQLHTLRFKSPHTLIDNQVKFIYPLSVKHLEIDFYQDKNVSIFSNLESLGPCRLMEVNDVLKLKKLEKLIVWDQREINNLKALLLGKRANPAIVFRCVQIKDIEMLNKFSSDFIQFQFQNHSNLDSLKLVTEINYDHFIYHLPRDRSVDLFRRYSNVRVLAIHSWVDEDMLLSFMRNCQLLRLKVDSASLSQQFYDQLPSASLLIYLAIFEERDLDIDFSFLMKMNLKEIYTNQRVQIDENLNLNHLRHFETLRFAVNNKSYLITKNGRDDYKIAYPFTKKHALPNQFNFADLVRWTGYLNYRILTRTKAEKLR